MPFCVYDHTDIKRGVKSGIWGMWLKIPGSCKAPPHPYAPSSPSSALKHHLLIELTSPSYLQTCSHIVAVNKLWIFGKALRRSSWPYNSVGWWRRFQGVPWGDDLGIIQSVWFIYYASKLNLTRPCVKFHFPEVKHWQMWKGYCQFDKTKWKILAVQLLFK